MASTRRHRMGIDLRDVARWPCGVFGDHLPVQTD
jgi:hypothetical protein